MDKKELARKIGETVDQYITDNTPKLEYPNDKIVLSADLFSKIVNILSYAEGQGICDPIMEELFNDVKKNRTSLTKTETKKWSYPFINKLYIPNIVGDDDNNVDLVQF